MMIENTKDAVGSILRSCLQSGYATEIADSAQPQTQSQLNQGENSISTVSHWALWLFYKSNYAKDKSTVTSQSNEPHWAQ